MQKLEYSEASSWRFRNMEFTYSVPINLLFPLHVLDTVFPAGLNVFERRNDDEAMQYDNRILDWARVISVNSCQSYRYVVVVI